MTRWCEIDLTKVSIPATWPEHAYRVAEEYWEDNEEWIIVEVLDPTVEIPEEWLI